MKDGASAEISVVGNDGVVGVALRLGGETTPSRAVVQSAGSAYRLRSKRLKDEFYRHGKAQLLLGYTQALLTQMAQTAVCNRHHPVSDRTRSTDAGTTVLRVLQRGAARDRSPVAAGRDVAVTKSSVHHSVSMAALRWH
jgi:hypothetical protein